MIIQTNNDFMKYFIETFKYKLSLSRATILNGDSIAAHV